MAWRTQIESYHHGSMKHVDRYLREFSGRHNIRELDTIEQMSSVAQTMVGKRLGRITA